MSIRVKLAAVLCLAVCVTTISAGAIFVMLERRSLRAAEDGKVRLLVVNIKTMAAESQLARDPLMLLDYLSFLGRDRKEVSGVRVRFVGRWERVAGLPGARESGPVRTESVLVPAQGDSPEILVETDFSRRVLDESYAASFRAMARDLGRAGLALILAGVLISVPLGWSLTSRLVAIERSMEAIGAGEPSEAVPAHGSDEVARLARGLNAMAARLRELDEMKRTFVASVTHELRSPLFAIESYVKLLLKDSSSLSVEERRQLERVQGNAARLAHFVTSLLDMARIERGKLEYRPRPLDLASLVEDATLFLGSRAAEEGKTLAFTAAPGLPQVNADPDLITQVVTNLVSNAIKFTPCGGRVSVALRRDGRRLECCVTDTGRGIPPEALPRLFQPFARAGNAARTGGTGLGLSICKSIMEMHRGAIGVESVPGRGSRFHFTLPCREGG
ncbi:MAG: hypothetical protein A2V88_11090 [Elusimicrobia bacterium RBG_16_66_12]|nr:MAG: hypothetical protein A2V88_11090 [Elusimicrobia bacterium RBG_16_66_12]